mmetsp:Transcript_94754/g.116054  ORF Transcript_94754/g.116054 Transcript_94754/m.116054 type:complete len:103 (+) Transcript_94754:516-824(+)
MDINMSTTIDDSKTTSITQTSKQIVTVKVPPKSKITVELIGQFSKETINFEIPIICHGYIGANFGRRINGHYYWFQNISTLTNGIVSAEFTASIGKVLPINV